MQLNLNEEFINDLRQCNIMEKYTRDLVAYMQPKLCTMITEPLDINIDICYINPPETGRIMASTCFGTLFVYLRNVKEFMGAAFYRQDALVYLSFLVCHELMHMDQNINSSRYDRDPQYNWYIESAVNYNAILFLFDHVYDLVEILNISIEDYERLLKIVIRNEFCGIYNFCNTLIEPRSLIDYYTDLANSRLNEKIRAEFMQVLMNDREVSIAVAYVKDINDYIDENNDIDIRSIALSDNIVSTCIIKDNWQLLPVTENIINTIDYIHGFKGFQCIEKGEGDISVDWYGYVVSNDGFSCLLMIKDFASLSAKRTGFKKEEDL